MRFEKMVEAANKIRLEKIKQEVDELNLKYLRKLIEYCNDSIDALEEEKK